MRILVLSPGYPLDGERYGYAVAEQIGALAARHDIRVQSLAPRDRLPATLSSEPAGWSRGVPVFAPAPGTKAQRLRAAWRRHRADPPDVVWSLWIDRSGLAGLALARLFGARWVASVMGGELADEPRLGYGGARSLAGRARVKAVLRRADALTVGSAWLGRRARTLVPDVRLHVTPIGVPAERVPSGEREPWRPGGPLRLLTVTDASVNKGAGHVFGALRHLRAAGHDASLTVCTLAPEAGRARLLDLARAQAVLPYVDLRPALDAPQLYASLPRHHALLSGSAHESQGLAFIEAALAGLPVVAPPVGVIEDLVGLEAAWVSAPGDAASLARAAVLAAQAAPDARAEVAARFDLARTTAGFEAALEGAGR